MKTVIIGAGLSGMAAGIKLKEKGADFVILEKAARPGGLAKSENINGFVFDYTGHFLHIRKPEIEKLVLSLPGVKLKKISRASYIFSNGVYTEYPYQVNNYGLPSEVIEENITGFLRARFAGRTGQANFRDWALATFGEGIAKNFLFPYNKKLWRHPLQKLTTKWMGRFVPSPTIDEVMDGILKKGKADVGYNAYFYYPEQGGIETLAKGFYEKLKDRVVLNAEVKAIDLPDKTITYNNETIKYDTLITTMPLNLFLGIAKGGPAKYAAKLKATSVYCLNIGFKQDEKTARHWVYVPEEKYVFYRIGFPSSVCPANAPDGMQSVFTEVSFHGNVPAGTDDKIISGLIDMGIIKNKNGIIIKYPMMLPDAYVIYDNDREKILPEITEKLKACGVLTAGRWGNWEYSSMEDAIIEGLEAAGRV